MYENKEMVVLKIELPGVSRKDLHIDIEHNHLLIEGIKENNIEELTPLLSECSYGNFNRVIALPKGTRDDYIKIDRIDGVLTLTIPKKRRSDGEDS